MGTTWCVRCACIFYLGKMLKRNVLAGNSQRFTVLFKGHVTQARFRPRRNEYFMSGVGFYSYWLPKGWFWVNSEFRKVSMWFFWLGHTGQPWLKKSEMPKLLRLFALHFKEQTHRFSRTVLLKVKSRGHICAKRMETEEEHQEKSFLTSLFKKQ